MRALVVSDTHFGAWTGDDVLRHDWALERLAPHLEDIDELVLLGDLFDFLFGSVADAVDASSGLLALIGAKLRGKRFVFLAGNHDHGEHGCGRPQPWPGIIRRQRSTDHGTSSPVSAFQTKTAHPSQSLGSTRARRYGSVPAPFRPGAVENAARYPAAAAAARTAWFS